MSAAAELPPPPYIFAEARLPPVLEPWIETLWYSSGELEHRRERVLPSGTADIVANLGPAMHLVEGNGDPVIRGTTVSGLMIKPFVLEHPAVHEAVGLRLRPLGIRALLGVPARLVYDRCETLGTVLQTAGDELAERCADARDAAGVLRAAVAWACERVSRVDAACDALVQWAVGRIERERGVVSIAQLQERSGYGTTRFVARFTEELGLTPKRYARLVRFRHVLEALDPNRSLADLALAAGFADQSHLNNEFQRLAEATPSEVLASRYPSGITLAEE